MSFKNIWGKYRRKNVNSDFRKIFDDSNIKYIEFGEKMDIKFYEDV